MAFWNKFPYTDFHELNLDWILQKIGLVDKAKLDAEAARDAAETAQASAESSQAAAAASQAAAAASKTAAEAAADRTQDLYDNIGGTVAPQVTAWLNENVNPVGSAVIVDSSLSINGAAADAKITGNVRSTVNDYQSNVTLVKNLVSEIVVGYNCNISTTTATLNQVLITADSARSYVKIPVIGGHTYSVNAQFSGNFSFWAYEDAGIEYGITPKITTFNTNYVITAPNNATILYLCNTGWNANTDIVIIETDISILNYTKGDYPFNTVTAVDIDKLSGDVVDNINGVYDNKILARGNIAISNSGWNFLNSTSRARTNADNIYHLYAGDRIVNSNPENIKMYIGYRSTNGAYYYAGWLQTDFIIPFECDCVILLSYVDEVTIASADELAQYIKVYKNSYIINNAQIKNNEITANVKSVNHQGYNYIAPNESLAAYELSKKYGYDYVECDVQKTSDGVYVLNHDNNIAITGTFYNITGSNPVLVTADTLISDLTYSQLVSSYDMRKSLNDDYAGTKIAKFDDFILLCKHLGLHAYIEIKTGGSADTRALYDIVNSYGMLENVTWISTVINYLNQIKTYDDSARLGYVVQNVTTEKIAEAQTVQTANNEVFLDANYTNLTTESVNLCINAGLKLEVWTVNTNTAMTSLNPYVTRVTSDRLKYSEVFENT